jgi:hypothetical protein
MKKLLLIFIVSIFAITGYSQDKPKPNKPNPEFWEAIKTKRIAVFTENIGLTSAEAQQFWPVYNAFDKERTDLMRKRRELDQKLEESKTGLTDVEYRKMANDFIATHMDEARLMESYNIKYLKILPAEKVCKLYRAERKFREYLMHEFRKNQVDGKDK